MNIAQSTARHLAHRHLISFTIWILNDLLIVKFSLLVGKSRESDKNTSFVLLVSNLITTETNLFLTDKFNSQLKLYYLCIINHCVKIKMGLCKASTPIVSSSVEPIRVCKNKIIMSWMWMTWLKFRNSFVGWKSQRAVSARYDYFDAKLCYDFKYILPSSHPDHTDKTVLSNYLSNKIHKWNKTVQHARWNIAYWWKSSIKI